MPGVKNLTVEERVQIELLIDAFDDHGCGIGLDLKAQVALRRLLSALDEAEQTVQEYRAMDLERQPAAEKKDR